MKGTLNSNSALSQLLIIIGIALVSIFIFGLMGSFIMSAITGIPVTIMSDSSKWDYSKPETFVFIRGMQIVQFIGLFLIPSLWAAKLFSTDGKKYLGFTKPSNSLYFIVGVLAIMLSLPFVEWLGLINKDVQFPLRLEKWLKGMEDEASKTILGLLSKHSIKELILNIFIIAGLAAVGEELLFRGVLQRIFIKLFKSPWAGIIVTAIIFSAIHLQFYGFLPRFALGILLGVIYWYSGSLWTAILAHFVYDASLIVLAYFNPEMLDDKTSLKISNIGVLAGISLFIVVLSIFWMKKSSVTKYEDVYAEDLLPVKDHPF